MISFARNLMANFLYYSGIDAVIRKIGNKKTIILAYHRVLNLDKNFYYDSSNISSSVDNFNLQMQFLSKYYHVISLEEYIESHKARKSLSKNTCVITFDDGYKDSYTDAYPILKRLRLPATIYLTTGYIGNNILFWWDELTYIINKTRVKEFKIDGLGNFNLNNKEKILNKIKASLKDMDEDNRLLMMKKLSVALKVKTSKSEMFLSWTDIEMMKRSNISFGAHTVNHPILTNIPENRVSAEIKTSKSMIEQKIKSKVTSFAYPNGHVEDFNDKTIKILKGNGFESAVTYIPGFVDADSDLFKLNRVFVRYEDDMIVFKSKMIGMDIFFGRIYYFFNRMIGKRR